MMRVIIEGNLEQIKSACWTIVAEPAADEPEDHAELAARRLSNIQKRQENKMRLAKITAQRNTLYEAYRAILHDPEKQNALKRLVATLAGRSPITKSILQEAESIIASIPKSEDEK
jgi:hypothetical protein